MAKAKLFSEATYQRLRDALKEDIGAGDITSNLLISQNTLGKAVILARESGIFCGAPVLSCLFHFADPNLKMKFPVKEGKAFSKNKIVFEAEGNLRSILKAERTALNLLGHLSGVATQTHALAQKVKKFGVKILDTRKTTPLWRELEKYAVRTGGGMNHRFGLYDEIFVKENHRLWKNLGKLSRYPRKFEIEVRNEKEIRKALKLKPRVILFDNFSPAKLKRAAAFVKKQDAKVICEASGGVTAANAASFAKTGVDWISSGAITHSVKSINFSLLIIK